MVWGEVSRILYGNKRHLVDEFRELAEQGQWQEAKERSNQLNPIRLALEYLLPWKITETATCAGTIAGVKA